MREILDVHTHCFAGTGDAPAVTRGIAALSAIGVRGLVTVGLVNAHLEPAHAWRIVPEWVEHRGDPSLHEAQDLLAFASANAPAILPFVDTRHLWGEDVPALLGEYLAQGFRGLKGLYLAEEPNDLGVASIPSALGISKEAYHRREWEIFAFARDHGLPVIYHMDARRHGDVMAAILQDFPTVRFDFPHFGISRRAFARILEHHPNAFTDVASMLPHLRQDPAGYRDFLCAHADRVCFGSDAFLYRLETVGEYVDAVEGMGLPPEVRDSVFTVNPRRFLGPALGAPLS
ncbi:MAG: amidohydrolase family protein [Proteobacteria bacterium]|nr:amidohydrolase family protein [Pseudomonadota bacterium]